MKADCEGGHGSVPEPGDREQKNKVEEPLPIVAVLPGVRGSKQQAEGSRRHRTSERIGNGTCMEKKQKENAMLANWQDGHEVVIKCPIEQRHNDDQRSDSDSAYTYKTRLCLSKESNVRPADG